MRIGLFIPCYIDLLFPEVGIATLELLERLGFEVGYPLGQTCCGQPMSNSGDERNAVQAEHLFVENFKDFGCIVGPAGSCVKHVRQHFDPRLPCDERFLDVEFQLADGDWTNGSEDLLVQGTAERGTHLAFALNRIQDQQHGLAHLFLSADQRQGAVAIDPDRELQSSS